MTQRDNVINVSEQCCHQAITWTNAGLLWIRSLATNLGELSSNSQIFITQNASENVENVDHFVQASTG